jgi:hypothetical protein
MNKTIPQKTYGFNSFSATVLSENRSRSNLVHSHNNMTFDEITEMLRAPCWQPIHYSVQNYEWLRKNIDKFEKNQLFGLVKDLSMTSLDGTVRFIMKNEDIPMC